MFFGPFQYKKLSYLRFLVTGAIVLFYIRSGEVRHPENFSHSQVFTS